VRLPRNLAPAQLARRALLADLAIAVLLMLVAIAFAAGIGVVGFIALLVLSVTLAWIAVEAAVRALLHRRAGHPGRERRQRASSSV
jgi:hypothetical protein